MTTTTLTLPTLDEIEAYYAALPAEAVAAYCRNANACLLHPFFAKQFPMVPAAYIDVAVGDPETTFPKYGAYVTIYDQRSRNTEKIDLSEELNALAWRFDELKGPHVAVTAGECVQLVRDFRAARKEAQ